jgi:hypothetical protein
LSRRGGNAAAPRRTRHRRTAQKPNDVLVERYGTETLPYHDFLRDLLFVQIGLDDLVMQAVESELKTI